MKVFEQDEDQGLKRIKNRDLNICVVGIGTIGLPLATFLAKSGFNVKGLDVDENRVREVNSGEVIFEYGEMLKDALNSNKLQGTTNSSEALKNADAIFVCVPTPLDKDKNLDTSKLFSAVEEIIKNIDKGTLLIVESSVSVGVTRKLGTLIEERTGLKMGKDFGLAYCPERYNPTLPQERFPTISYNNLQKETSHIYTLDNVNRVIGGTESKSRILAKTIYSQFIKHDIKEVSSIEASEATKLIENIFRDVNIALVNEFAKVFPKLNLDTYEIIEAAKTKPFAFLPHYPGAGVGGECIPVDTWYLIKQAQELGIDTKLMKAAREVNDSMIQHTVKLLEESLSHFNKNIAGSNITVLGLAYKSNIADTRLSPGLNIVKVLESKGATIVKCDPLVEKTKNNHNLVSLDKAFENSDAILLITDHDVFKNLDFSEIKKKVRTPILIDGRNIYNENHIKSNGFHYRVIGR